MKKKQRELLINKECTVRNKKFMGRFNRRLDKLKVNPWTGRQVRGNYPDHGRVKETEHMKKKLRDMEDRVTRANKNLIGVPDELKE